MTSENRREYCIQDVVLPSPGYDIQLPTNRGMLHELQGACVENKVGIVIIGANFMESGTKLRACLLIEANVGGFHLELLCFSEGGVYENIGGGRGYYEESRPQS